jgi:hypothetical protein
MATQTVYAEYQGQPSAVSRGVLGVSLGFIAVDNRYNCLTIIYKEGSKPSLYDKCALLHALAVYGVTDILPFN